MRYIQKPFLCSRSYAERWPTGVPYTHEQLIRHRRGRYWKQIIDVPDNNRATPRYQYAEYNHGYEAGLRETCQDAEWYIGWLFHYSRGLNVPNGFLLGYMHGSHFRTTGVQCVGEVPHRRHVAAEMEAAKFTPVESFAEVKPSVNAWKPSRGKKPTHKKQTVHDVIGEALLSMMS